MLPWIMRICGITKSYVKGILDFFISYLGGFRDGCTVEPQIQLLSMAIWSPHKIGHFLDIYSGSLKFIFQFILILETISYKNCETRNISLLIQCWLQVYLFIPGLHCFEKLFGIGKHLVRGQAQSWVSLSKSNIFLGLPKIQHISIVCH